MRKGFILILLCFCSLAFAAPLQERALDKAALWELATTLGLSSEEDLVAQTQKQWLRKAGQERWEMAELPPGQRAFILNWAQQQGLFSSWLPSSSHYEKALILGGGTERMVQRLNHLKQLWEEGVRFEEVVWLTGDRPLDKQIDTLLDQCQTESDAARLIWEKSDLPEGMRSLPVVFVAVPMWKEGGQLRRPNTQDTLIAWLELKPTPCKLLFVSNQPFCGYQHAIIHGTLPDDFPFDVVGPGADPAKHPKAPAAAIILDTVARWLYAESLITH